MALATKNNIAQVYASEEGDTEAIDICTKGLDMRKAIQGEKSIDYAFSLNNLALIYYEMGILEYVKDVFSDALEIKKELLPEIHGQISVGYFNLGLVYDKLDQDKEALENCRVSMEVDNKLGTYEDVLLRAEYVTEIYERNNMLEEAETYRTLCNRNGDS